MFERIQRCEVIVGVGPRLYFILENKRARRAVVLTIDQHFYSAKTPEDLLWVRFWSLNSKDAGRSTRAFWKGAILKEELGIGTFCGARRKVHVPKHKLVKAFLKGGDRALWPELEKLYCRAFGKVVQGEEPLRRVLQI